MFCCFLDQFLAEHPSLDNENPKLHIDRLSTTIKLFKLDKCQNSCHLLEIGPYLSMTPFYYKSLGAKRITVMDGDSPEIHQFADLYRAKEIDFVAVDLGTLFGDNAERKFPFPDETFDRTLCWETIEHFNFNPIPFVDEIKRVTRIGGEVSVTVPNIASIEKRLDLLRGHGPFEPIDNFVKELDADQNFKYGLHWREYTLKEISELFVIRGFEITNSSYLQTFEKKEISTSRALRRGVGSFVTRIVPSFCNLCCLSAKRVE